ncbi:MAG: hypothetical protein J1E96_07380 [Ruminococcus sp.]|nr:hypothetical protein [Ruminococcus sp.]
MDTKIGIGDFIVKPNGYVETVEDEQQMLQQINFAANIPKGSFIYDRSIGVFSGNIDINSKNAERTAEMLINEGLINTGVKVIVNKLEKRPGQTAAKLTADNGFKSIDTEVIIYDRI